jgi:hypothetical protein
MTDPKPLKSGPPRRLWAILLIFLSLSMMGGSCISTKKKVSVSPVLGPLSNADVPQLLAEVNRLAAVRSLRGKVDIEFLDTSFAECGLIDKYRTAEGDLIMQRPGQIYLSIKAPFGVKVAEMSSTGERFWVALYQGEERFKRFVTGRNEADYGKLSGDGAATAGSSAQSPCQNGDRRDEKSVQRTVSSLSSLRPQHLTGSIMVRPAADGDAASRTYAVSEDFVEEPDTRPGAKKDMRVVRGYYILVELEPTEQGRARVLRRFWFDRFGGPARLARVQNYDDSGTLTTDVVYRDPKPFGEGSDQSLPREVVLTRPQERYSVRISFQSPEEVKINRQEDAEIFILRNTSDLQEVDLDKPKR